MLLLDILLNKIILFLNKIDLVGTTLSSTQAINKQNSVHPK